MIYPIRSQIDEVGNSRINGSLVSFFYGNSQNIFIVIQENGTTTTDNSIPLKKLSRKSDNYKACTRAQVQ
jgi:hypothetical protein